MLVIDRVVSCLNGFLFRYYDATRFRPSVLSLNGRGEAVDFSSVFFSTLSFFSLLLACVFSFSFNNFFLTKYYFPLGQFSFVFLLLFVFFGKWNFSGFSMRAYMVFALYAVFSALFICSVGGVCTSRPWTALVTLAILFFIVESIAVVVRDSGGIELLLKHCFVIAGWLVVLFAIPDIVALGQGGIERSILEGGWLRFSTSGSYDAPRLRGYTQEPSYLGMVLAVLYPFALDELNKKFKVSSVGLVFGIWVCLVFSLSKVGIISCLFISVIFCFNKIRLWLRLFFVFFILWLSLIYVLPVKSLLGQNVGYTDQWVNKKSESSGSAAASVTSKFLLSDVFRHAESDSIVNPTSLPRQSLESIHDLPVRMDISTRTRVGHMVAALNCWFDNFLIGVGLGQSGFVLNRYYPDWLWLSPEAEKWAGLANAGGIPAFAFLPKVGAELGFFGVLMLAIPLFYLLKGIARAWAYEPLRVFVASFCGFLIASFGVEGYLYFPAWIIFGVIIGIARRVN